jgi:hypothetical protein
MAWNLMPITIYHPEQLAICGALTQSSAGRHKAHANAQSV